jgi:hypothetical protein
LEILIKKDNFFSSDIFYRNPTLGLATKARGCKVTSQKRSPGVQESERIDPHTPQGNSHFGSWSPEFSKSDCKVQNPSPWRSFYIIRQILKRKCLKWARMIHLDIWNTSYGQKKGRESNWQFDSRSQKVGNQPDFLAFKWRETCCYKDLNEGYNFTLKLIPIGGLHKKL